MWLPSRSSIAIQTSAYVSGVGDGKRLGGIAWSRADAVYPWLIQEIAHRKALHLKPNPEKPEPLSQNPEAGPSLASADLKPRLQVRMVSLR